MKAIRAAVRRSLALSVFVAGLSLSPFAFAEAIRGAPASQTVTIPMSVPGSVQQKQVLRVEPKRKAIAAELGLAPWEQSELQLSSFRRVELASSWTPRLGVLIDLFPGGWTGSASYSLGRTEEFSTRSDEPNLENSERIWVHQIRAGLGFTYKIGPSNWSLSSRVEAEQSLVPQSSQGRSQSLWAIQPSAALSWATPSWRSEWELYLGRSLSLSDNRSSIPILAGFRARLLF